MVDSYEQLKLKNPSMKTLWCMMGLPRSGKSTWARLSGYPMVCPDAIRLAMYESAYIESMEPHVWAIAETTAKAAFIAGHQDVVIDATSTNIKQRDRWVRLMRKGMCDHIVFVHVWASTEDCKSRAVMDGREDLVPVIERKDQEMNKGLLATGQERVEGTNYILVYGNELIQKTYGGSLDESA